MLRFCPSYFTARSLFQGCSLSAACSLGDKVVGREAGETELRLAQKGGLL